MIESIIAAYDMEGRRLLSWLRLVARIGTNADPRDRAGLGAASSHGKGPSNLSLVRIVFALFFAPNLILASGLGVLAGAVIALGCALSAVLIWCSAPRHEGAFLARPIDFSVLAGCAVLATALCLLGGETHLFYANADWLFRDAVLADIVRQGFPTFYRYQEQDYLLRAPLGMYMAPAMVGRLLGLQAAHVALLAQNASILALVLYFLAQLSGINKLAFLGLFVAFSGLDIVGALTNALLDFARSGEFVAPSRVEGWNRYLHYSSHVTQIFWVPNHALPGWWFAVLALLHARREIDIGLLLVSVAALVFWSPLAMLGALPFVAYFCARLLPTGLFTPSRLLAAGAAACFLPVAIYIGQDAGTVAHEWLIGADGFAWAYASFAALAFPHAAIIAFAWRKIDCEDRPILVAAVAVLLLLPFYWFGPKNDFVMRASIPAYTLLAFAFARVAALVPRDGGAFAISILVVIAASAATPAFQIERVLTEPTYPISDCNFLTSWSKLDPERWPTNYFARASNMPRWLVPAHDERLTLEDRICWPGNPLMGDVAR